MEAGLIVSHKKVVISILNWRSAEDTVSCIAAVKQIVGEGQQIVVVDNASGDDSVSVIKSRYPDIYLITASDNLGYAAGHQLAVDYAMEKEFDAIWILNPDLEVHPNALDALMNAWEKWGDAIYGSISLQSANDDTILFAGAHELNGDEETSDYNPYKSKSLKETLAAQQTRKVTAVEGFSLLAPLSLIQQHGFMDHRYFMYGEETIWCYDLRKQGVPVFIVPESIVYHMGFGSLGGEKATSNPVVVYYRMRNAIYWKRKHYGLKWIDVLKRKGGPLAHIKFFFKYWTLGKKQREGMRNGYFENLAIIHSLIGKKGRVNGL